MISQTLSHYCIVEKTGAGCMRKVYRARIEHLLPDSAIKALTAGTLQDERARKRFRVEAEARSKLIHNHIAPCTTTTLRTEWLPGNGYRRVHKMAEELRVQKELTA